MKLWKRWDPRTEPMPLREVKVAKRWVIEVVPDIFAPGCEALARRTLKAIGALRYQRQESIGRFLLRSAHPAAAVGEFRRINDHAHGRRGHDSLSEVPSRVVLALYAETQAQFDAGVVALFAPRARCEALALTNPAAGIALALKEGWIFDGSYWETARNEAIAKGPEAVVAYLTQAVGHNRSDGIGVDTGGLALYLSPRERIDIGAYLTAVKVAGDTCRTRGGTYCDNKGWHNVPPRAFDWIVCAGKIGPVPKTHYGTGPQPERPHPMHPAWLTEIATAAGAAGIPFCLPYLGEWAEESLNVDVPHEHVDYDPTWTWGERGWDDAHRSAKPHGITMSAVGAEIAGRQSAGQLHDQWPRHWCER